MAEITGDVLFVCPARRAARQLVQAGVPTYLYHFSQIPLPYQAVPFLQSTHTAEIAFVFHNPILGIKLFGDDIALSEAMMRYWTRFAGTADPNGGSDVTWAPTRKRKITIWGWRPRSWQAAISNSRPATTGMRPYREA